MCGYVGICVCVEQCFQTSNLNNCGIVVNMKWELRIGCMRRKFNSLENLQFLNGISDLQKRSKTFFCMNFGWCSCLELHAMHRNAILPLKLNRSKKQNYNTFFFFQYVVIFCTTSVKYMLVLFHQNDAGDNLISNVFIKKPHQQKDDACFTEVMLTIKQTIQTPANT